MIKADSIQMAKEIGYDVASTAGVVIPFTDLFTIFKGGVGLATMIVILLINIKRYRNLNGKDKKK